MTTIDDLHRRRKEIIEMASVIEGLMTPQQLAIHPIAKVTHILLCDLCEMMSDHLADEHKGLYPNLLTHGDTSVKNMAWGLINNDKLLKPEFNQYKRKWLRDCEFQFTEEFIQDTQEILKTLRQRMELEENTVIPRLVREEILSPA
ncbi:MAG: hemerythrin domain-containing protein [Gammaproteobacteria bacterium]|nr:MAG: hemerythrin domain-containing protein [Gammaproteobacteria bacterium]